MCTLVLVKQVKQVHCAPKQVKRRTIEVRGVRQLIKQVSLKFMLSLLALLRTIEVGGVRKLARLGLELLQVFQCDDVTVVRARCS